MKYGLIYIAVDNLNYLFGAIASAASARVSGNTCPIQIVTNIQHHAKEPLKKKYDLKFIEIKAKGLRWSLSRNIKTQIGKYSLTYKTLFLDCDTIVLSDLSEFTNYIGRDHDIAIVDKGTTVDLLRKRIESGRRWGDAPNWDIQKMCDECPPDHPYYNSGVFAWVKNKRTNTLFQNWNKEWQRTKKTDEASLVRAICKMDNLKLNNLPTTFNTASITPKKINPQTKIMHHIHGCQGPTINKIRMTNSYKYFYPNVHEVLLKSFGIKETKPTTFTNGTPVKKQENKRKHNKTTIKKHKTTHKSRTNNNKILRFDTKGIVEPPNWKIK